jgi:hypothetical protein
MDDFFFLADFHPAAVLLRTRIDALLTCLGMLRNPKKGALTTTHVGDPLGLTVSLAKGEFRGPPDKLFTLA